MNLEKLKTATEIVQFQEHSSDWSLKTNVDCPWNAMLIPGEINQKNKFESSIIYFNKKFINSEITIVPVPVFSYGLYSFRVNEYLVPIYRKFDIRKNWKRLPEIEQVVIMKTINEWLIEQFQNAEKKHSNNKVILFFYGIIERRIELNGYVKNGIEYVARYVIKVF